MFYNICLFLYIYIVKIFSPAYRFDVFQMMIHFSFCSLKEQKKREKRKTVLKCPCSFLQSLVLEHSGCTYRETEKGLATRRHLVSMGTSCCAR